MLVEIHTAYIETVASILLDILGTDLEEVSRTGSTITYHLDEDMRNEVDIWCNDASGCQLIYNSKFSYE